MFERIQAQVAVWAVGFGDISRAKSSHLDGQLQQEVERPGDV